MKSTFYIYALAEPNTLNVRYVGSTQDLAARFNMHLRGGKQTDKRKWISTLSDFPTIIVLDFATESNRAERESFWISKYKAEKCDLFNQRTPRVGKRNSILTVEATNELRRNSFVLNNVAKRIKTDKSTVLKWIRGNTKRLLNPDFIEAISAETGLTRDQIVCPTAGVKKPSRYLKDKYGYSTLNVGESIVLKNRSEQVYALHYAKKWSVMVGNGWKFKSRVTNKVWELVRTA